MSLVPAFEIGVWNAWILAIVFLLLVYIPILTLKDFSKKMGESENYGKTQTLMTILFYILLICSIFLSLKLWSVWFYAGIFVYLLGMITVTVTIVNVTSTPLGKPFTKGIYRYSRNQASHGKILINLSNT